MSDRTQEVPFCLSSRNVCIRDHRLQTWLSRLTPDFTFAALFLSWHLTTTTTRRITPERTFVEDTEGNTLSKSELPSSTGSRDIDLGSRRLELCSAARRATLLGLRRANEQSDQHETRDPGRGHQGRARVQIWASYDEGKPRYRGRKLRYEFYTFRRWR